MAQISPLDHPVGVTADQAIRATVTVRRLVPDLDGQAEILGMLGLADSHDTEPPPPPAGTLWTVADVARRTGRSRESVRQLVHTPGFPAPAGQLDGARAWEAHQVEPWLTQRRPTTRPAGQPTASTQETV